MPKSGKDQRAEESEDKSEVGCCHEHTNKFDYFDTHLHSIFLSNFEMELLNTNGMKWCVTACYAPIPPKQGSAFEFLFDWLSKREPQRLAPLGIESFSAIGIHPRSIPADNIEAKNAIETLTGYLTTPSSLTNNENRRNIVAIGEIGLETNSETEKKVFERQLEIAKAEKLPVIVHTPRKDKKNITKLSIEIISSFMPLSVIIDHVNQENFLTAYDSEHYLGLTIQTNKLSSVAASELLHAYDIRNRVVLNSDVCDVNNEMGGIINLITRLYDNGADKMKIASILRENAKRIFNL